MSNNVKWIKVATTIFDNDKMQFINSLKNNDTIFYLWFRVLILAGKSNLDGALKLNQRVKYTDEHLASIFDRDIKVVKEAMQLFVDLEMLERNKSDVYIVANWDRYQSANELAKIREGQRRRQQAYRDRNEKRVAVFSESNSKCVYCGRSAEALDHVIPKSKGGSDDISNLVGACKSCNSTKFNLDLSYFLNNEKTSQKPIVDFKLILKNEKLMSFVNYDKVSDRFKMKEQYQEKNDKNIGGRW